MAASLVARLLAVPVVRDALDGDPIVLLDAGARGGVRSRWYDLVPHLRVIAVEPDAATESTGSGAYPVIVVRRALDETPGRRTLYVTKAPQKSSLLPPDQDYARRFTIGDHFDVVRTDEVEVGRLDDELAALGVGRVDFAKIDVQGAELGVLRGGVTTFEGAVLGVDVEVNFSRRYVGAPHFSEIDVFLRERGYELFDLQRSFLKKKIGLRHGDRRGQLSHAKALYLRTPEHLSKLLADDPAAATTTLVRYVVLSALYGYVDHALFVLDAVGDVLPTRDRRAMVTALTADMPLARRIPLFRGRGRLARLLRRATDILEPHDTAGGFVDERLGNS